MNCSNVFFTSFLLLPSQLHALPSAKPSCCSVASFSLELTVGPSFTAARTVSIASSSTTVALASIAASTAASWPAVASATIASSSLDLQVPSFEG